MGRIQQLSQKYPKLIWLGFRIINRFPLNNSKIKWQIFDCKGLMQKCSAKIRGSDNRVMIGANSRLVRCKFYINGTHSKIIIGENCNLIDTEFYIEDNNGSIKIGDRTNITGSTQLAAIEGCSISIGEDCLFSSDIKVRTGDSHPILNMDDVRINPSCDVVLHDRVWVGNRVTILKGSVIPNDCVIGSASVVTKAYSEMNSIYAGNPAKMIKTKIKWTSKR